MTHPTTRDLPVEPAHTALLFIDVQNYCATAQGGEWAGMDPSALEASHGWFFREMQERTIPAMQRLQRGCRAAGIEVMYTVIRNLTRDGRDRSLDYKITGFNVPPDSWDGQVIDELAPGEDEIVLPKTSSNVFISTHIDYILRNLGVKYLMIAGNVTDQCIESAVRDGCDLGYLVTLVTDSCCTYSQERHDASLRAIRGYCRQRTTDQVLTEISPSTASAMSSSLAS